MSPTDIIDPLIFREPKVTLEQSYVPMSNVVAQRVQDMFKLTLDGFSTLWRYDIGTVAALPVKKITIKNITLNASILIQLEVPTIVALNDPIQFSLAPGESTVSTLQFNEITARVRSSTTQKEYDDQIVIRAIPFNITGPVYIDPTAQ